MATLMQVPPLRLNQVLTLTSKTLSEQSGLSELQDARDSFDRAESVSGTALATSGSATLTGYTAFAGELVGVGAIAGLPLIDVANGAFGVSFLAQSAIDAIRAVKQKDASYGWKAAVKAAAGGLMVAGAAASFPALGTAGSAVGLGLAGWEYRGPIKKAAGQTWDYLFGSQIPAQPKTEEPGPGPSPSGRKPGFIL